MKTYLVLDATYLCHRAFHAFPELRHGTDATGVLYGFFRELVTLKDTHNTSDFIFCFDYGRSKRREAFNGYKAKRLQTTPFDIKDGLHFQMDDLRTHYLPELGYRNIFFQSGYEADDVIASVIGGSNARDDMIIVSSDKDMYQLLMYPRVCIWNPAKKKAYTAASLKKQYGIDPVQWPYVKALAGCSSDDIPGCPGVGEITAAKYLTGKLKPSLKAWQAIEAWQKDHSEDIKRNLSLVKLPYPGTAQFTIREDEFTEDKWRAVCKKLGMKSLLRNSPAIIQSAEKQGFLFD